MMALKLNSVLPRRIPPATVTMQDLRLRELAGQRWPIAKLIPYARNARTHSDAQVAQIAASICGSRMTLSACQRWR